MNQQELETMLRAVGYSDTAIENIVNLYCWGA